MWARNSMVYIAHTNTMYTCIYILYNSMYIIHEHLHLDLVSPQTMRLIFYFSKLMRLV